MTLQWEAKTQMPETQTFFGLSPTHVLMAAVGTAVIVAYLLPRLAFMRVASSSAILMILGLVAFAFIPGMPEPLDPTVSPSIWEVISEIAVIVVLFATGLRIDNVSSWSLLATYRAIEFVDPEIEALQDRIAARLGYRLIGHRMELLCVPVKKA